MNYYFKPVMLASLMALHATMLYGCKEASQSAPTQSNTSVGQTNTKPVKKIGAAIAFNHSYDGSTNIGQVESFELTFQPTQAIDRLSIELRSPDNILLGGNQSLTPAVTGVAVVKVPVSIQTNAEGKFYLNILVQTEQGGKRLGRAYAVAIKVGDMPTAQKTDHENKDNVHIMPAQEEIR